MFDGESTGELGLSCTGDSLGGSVATSFRCSTTSTASTGGEEKETFFDDVLLRRLRRRFGSAKEAGMDDDDDARPPTPPLTASIKVFDCFLVINVEVSMRSLSRLLGSLGEEQPDEQFVSIVVTEELDEEDLRLLGGFLDDRRALELDGSEWPSSSISSMVDDEKVPMVDDVMVIVVVREAGVLSFN